MNPPKKHYRICDSPEFRNVFTQTAKMLNFEAELRRRWEEAQQQERAHFKALLEGQYEYLQRWSIKLMPDRWRY